MRKVFLPVIALALLAACAKKDVNNLNNTPAGKVAPDGFTYKTTKQITVDVTLLTNGDKAISGIPVTVYGFADNDTARRVATAVTDDNGRINYSISVPAYLDTFVVRPNFIGVINNAKVALSGNSLTCTLGGSTGFIGNIVGTFDGKLPAMKQTNAVGTTRGGINVFDINGVKTSTTFAIVNNGTADALGKPNYLEPIDDIISADLLKSITYSLPESTNLANSVKGSSYLASDATSDIIVKAKSDIWVTFAYEGAGYRNALGYYTYPTNNPPVTLADIKNITFIFPNSSLYGSGGNLKSGNKVKIGSFDLGTTIGFVVYADGWNATKGGANVNTGGTAFFSDSYLNPEKNAVSRKHSVLLNYTDPATKNPFYLVGFEDINREYASCDNDFNDVVYYVTSDPINGISHDNVKPVDIPKDSDGDGVNDVLDAYPNDATKAYNTYYPGVNQYGTLAFEDNWPLQGDYDLNDLVVRYCYQMISNAKNQVVEIDANFAPIAAGANYENALGIQLPFTTATVTSVKGQRLGNGYIKLNANGTESGQTNAVVIPFDGTKQMISNPDGSSFINTDPAHAKVTGDTAQLYIVLASPQSNVDASTFNPFLISNKRRGYEVHLPGFAPTNLADQTLFGTGNDASSVATGTYYVTKNNYPFAINFADAFSYPTETTPINKGYLHFFDWTLSAGKSYTDWYKNTAADYQNTSAIFTK